MTRILHLDTERTWRGGERQVLLLAREQRRRGADVWVGCRPGFPLAAACLKAFVPTTPVAPFAEWDPFAVAGLRRFLREKRIDVFHAHTGHAVGLGAAAVRGTPAKLVATRRVDFPLGENFLSRRKYGRLDALVAISEGVRAALVRSGRNAADIPVVPSAVDPAGYPTAADRARLRREKGFREDEPIVVNAAALVPHKDQATLLEAAARVRREVPATFLILGDGELRERLEAQAAALGLGDGVRFLGHRDDVLDFMALADMFAFSSSEEGLGTALLDALAIGIPVAATRAGGIPEIFGGPDAPELSPVRDPEALARGILAALKDPAERRRRVERGRENLKRFSVAAMADGYERIYEKLLRSSSPR